MRVLVPLLLLVGCGDDGGSSIPADAAIIDAPGGGSDGAVDAPPGTTFSITSTAYANGGTVPSAQACVNKGGMNLSPPLTIANPPAGTLSFAIVFTDITPQPLVHSALYDIPLATTTITGDVDKVYAPPDVPSAHQTNNYAGTRGYAGPCPGSAHMYQFKIYALSTATVTGATMATTKEQLVTLLATNLGTATLTGTFTPP